MHMYMYVYAVYYVYISLGEVAIDHKAGYEIHFRQENSSLAMSHMFKSCDGSVSKSLFALLCICPLSMQPQFGDSLVQSPK